MVAMVAKTPKHWIKAYAFTGSSRTVEVHFPLSKSGEMHKTAVDALRRQLASPPPGLRPNFALAMALADTFSEVM